MSTDPKTLDDAPQRNQRVLHEGKTYTTVQEGRAYILVPESEQERDHNGAVNSKAGPVRQVFYNPIQQFNRDLTVLAIKAYGEEVLERKTKSSEARVKRNKEKNKQKKAAREERKSNTAAEEKAASTTGEKRKREDNDESVQEIAPKVTKSDDVASPQMTKAKAEEKVEEQNSANQEEAVSKEDDGTTTTAATEQNPQTSQPKRPARFTILDALSATGLRALRYAQEIPFVTSVTANDLDPSAVKAIARNIEHNKLQDRIQVTKGNAIGHMYTKVAAHMELNDKDKARGLSEQYDVVDLDPYGTAANFFDAAVQAVRDDGGLLCVTCTDAGVWASNGYPEKAFALYGGVTLKGWHCHEAGLRLILNGIATAAARYGLAIEPLLSLSIDFYARVFVKVRKSPAEVKFAAGKTMVVYNCDSGCGAWTTQILLNNKPQINKNGTGTFYKHTYAQGPTSKETCEHCGRKTHMAGPMYAGRLHNPDFIRRILDKLPEADKNVYGTTERIKGMLTTAMEEVLEMDESRDIPKSREEGYAELEPMPFLFLPQQVAKVVHSQTPREDMLRSGLHSLGYKTTRSHTKPGSIKTDAPWKVIWHVMREWVRQKAPIKVESVKPGTPGWEILKMGEKMEQSDKAGEAVEKATNGADSEMNDIEKEDGSKEKVEEWTKKEVIFDEALGRVGTREKLVRYQMNPTENWGPMNRAKGQ